jgi:hypothetical protein
MTKNLLIAALWHMQRAFGFLSDTVFERCLEGRLLPDGQRRLLDLQSLKIDSETSESCRFDINGLDMISGDKVTKYNKLVFLKQPRGIYLITQPNPRSVEK